MNIFKDVPRGVLSRPRDEERIPNAAWANPEVIVAHLKYRPDRILLGAVGNQLIGVPDDRHIITVAGSRAGKGVSVIIPNLLHYRGSFLVIDPKGELASITARYRGEGLKQKVCVLDPFNRTPKTIRDNYQASFNPMSILELDSPTIQEDAGLISDALIIPSPYADPHWDQSARNFLEGVILHVATYEKYEGKRNLITVFRLLTINQQVDGEGEVLDHLLHEMVYNAKEITHANPILADAIEASANDFSEKPDREKGSVLSTLRRHIQFLSYPSMQSVLQKHDFDLKELKTAKQGMTIYLCLPAGKMGICNRWLRLFVNLALEAMEHESYKPDPPVVLCLDEFAVLGHMKQIEDAAGQIAGFGVKLWPIIQDLSQLKTLYKERWETFMGNAGVLQFFGNNDLTTLNFIEKRVGRVAVKTKRGTYGGGPTSQDSYGEELHPMVTAEEAALLFSRDDQFKRQLIIWPRTDPIIMERVVYFDKNSPLYPHFEGKFDVFQ